MNINDFEKQNAEKISTVNLKTANSNRVNKNYSKHDFYDYVKVSKTSKTEAKSNDTTGENENTEEENVEILTEEENNVPANTYIQTFAILNNEIFDLDIQNNKNNFRYNNDIFSYNIDLSNINENDIKLFEGLTQKTTDMVINSFDTQNQTFNMMLNGENVDVSYKSLEVSKTLFSALENAAKTGKSVRLDFGKDTSVILKVGKDGKLSADFIPNEKAMETVLKNAIPQLKAKLEEQNLPYKEITYKQYKQNNNQKNNKEKSDE